MGGGTLLIERVERAREQLFMLFRLDDLRFTTSYWYEGVDLPALERAYGAPFMRKVYFHIAAFEANKLASLRPAAFDLGPFADLRTEAFERLWRTVLRRVWGQWRYEHDLPDWEGPAFVGEAPRAPAAPGPVTVGGPAVGTSRSVEQARTGARAGASRSGGGSETGVEVLAFCGGGKDSLAALRLLERAGIPYASFAYAHSVYGRAEPQHALIDGLLDHCAPVRRHRQWVTDDAFDAPVCRLRPERGARYLLAAETPASLFGALPVALQRGYRYLCLAHEASANEGNLTWPATGEAINHQWGKSLEAERLLDGYLRRELVADARYFSILQPVHDPLIFYLLRDDMDAAAATHSCNEQKPWCGRCAKCAYVYLGYMAFLPPARVRPLFPVDPFDHPDAVTHYRAMLGLAAHTPFECIGQPDEVRLLFELCRRRGVRGRAIERYAAEAGPPAGGWPALIDRLLSVRADLDTIPPAIAAGALPQLERAASAARRELRALLATP